MDEETRKKAEDTKSPDNRLRSLITNLNDPVMLRSTENMLKKQNKDMKK